MDNKILIFVGIAWIVIAIMHSIEWDKYHSICIWLATAVIITSMISLWNGDKRIIELELEVKKCQKQLNYTEKLAVNGNQKLKKQHTKR